MKICSVFIRYFDFLRLTHGMQHTRRCTPTTRLIRRTLNNRAHRPRDDGKRRKNQLHFMDTLLVMHNYTRCVLLNLALKKKTFAHTIKNERHKNWQVVSFAPHRHSHFAPPIKCAISLFILISFFIANWEIINYHIRSRPAHIWREILRLGWLVVKKLKNRGKVC